jgi:hypothetical protein
MWALTGWVHKGMAPYNDLMRIILRVNYLRTYPSDKSALTDFFFHPKNLKAGFGWV